MINHPALPYPQMPGNDYTPKDLMEYGDARAAHARKEALEDVAVMATVGATYPELMEYIQAELLK